jgi:biopolymer transport protein ExbD
MAAFALRNGNRSVASEMNVTPLVDVMLVLCWLSS